MRCLSLHQPWLWSILDGPPPQKRVENRSWPPWPAIVGERIALHATRTWDAHGAVFLAGLGLVVPDQLALPRGAIVGLARVLGVVRSADALPDDQKRWFFGPFGWILDDVVPVKPVPARGMQGLWPVPVDVEQALEPLGSRSVELIRSDPRPRQGRLPGLL